MGAKGASFFMWVLLVFSAYNLKQVSADRYFINCGSFENFTIDGRVYLSENYAARYLETPYNIYASSSTNTDLYKTARIFNESSSYKFPITEMGRYFVRLHIPPFTYQNYNLSNSKFNVIVQDYELLSDYTPFGSTTVKEYSFNVSAEELEIFVTPSPNSVAFFSALEVFSVPNALIQNDSFLINPIAGFPIHLPDAALETSFRVNMGGPTVDQNEDPLWRTWESDDGFLENKSTSVEVRNMKAVRYRSGLSTNNFAPRTIYGTCRKLSSDTKSNITWKFHVDTDFQYLVRCHFCDIVSSSRNHMYFNVVVNSWLVSRPLNLTSQALGFLASPTYLDFITPIITGSEISVSIGPAAIYGNNHDAILNGLEIMKLNDEKRSLAVVSRVPSSKPESSSNHKKVLVYVIIGVVAISILVVILSIWHRRARKRRSQGQGQGQTEQSQSESMISPTSSLIPKSEQSQSEPMTSPTSNLLPMSEQSQSESMTSATSNLIPISEQSQSESMTSATSNLIPMSEQSQSESMTSSTSNLIPKSAIRFRHEQILEATENFAEGRIIGEGNFGKVYRGLWDGKNVAVKRLKLHSLAHPDRNEFQKEIELLSQFRHCHVLSLIGYCDEKNEIAVMCDYMENGDLEKRLFRNQCPLSWEERLKICIGAANGLNYLHYHCPIQVLHHDIKCSNILLDRNLDAKIADFGYSKVVNKELDRFSLTIFCKGTRGYCDPEYFKMHNYTEKSDVYSFGIVLLEILCGKRAFEETRDTPYLYDLVKKLVKNNEDWEHIIDSEIQEQIKPEAREIFEETIKMCIQKKGYKRPNMTVVLHNLENVQNLQKHNAPPSDDEASTSTEQEETDDENDHEAFERLKKGLEKW